MSQAPAADKTSKFSFRKIVVTEHGVYQPRLVKLDYLLTALILVLATTALFKTMSLGYATFVILILVIIKGYDLIQLRKYGPLGPPRVSIAKGMFFIDRPNDSRGGLSLPLSDLKQLIIYGREGRRIFRLVKQDSSYVEATPLWGANLDHAVIDFMQHALPEHVLVEEPQTLFAEIRGDGPITKS